MHDRTTMPYYTVIKSVRWKMGIRNTFINCTVIKPLVKRLIGLLVAHTQAGARLADRIHTFLAYVHIQENNFKITYFISARTVSVPRVHATKQTFNQSQYTTPKSIYPVVRDERVQIIKQMATDFLCTHKLNQVDFSYPPL